MSSVRSWVVLSEEHLSVDDFSGKLHMLGPRASPLLQRLRLKRLLQEVASARSQARSMSQELSAVAIDASGLSSQLQHVQQHLGEVQGELERRGQELGMSRSLLQQYHRTVQQLLQALEAVRALGGGPLLPDDVVAAAQKLRVANMQLEASRYVLDFCQEALSSTDPLGRFALVAALQHTTTTTTRTTVVTDSTPPALSTPPTTPTAPSPSTALPPLASNGASCSRPSTSPTKNLLTPPRDARTTTTTTTTATRTQLTLRYTTSQLSLSAAQAAWHTYFAAISVALEDPTQHTLAMLPALLSSLIPSLASTMYQAHAAYWTALLFFPMALLRSQRDLVALCLGASPQQAPRADASAASGVCAGAADVVVAYLNYALAMASSGLKILNTLTSAWCCVIHTAHSYAADALALKHPLGAPHEPQQEAGQGRALPVQLAVGLVGAQLGMVIAAWWVALGAWHMVVSVCCVLLGTCNLLGSFVASAVQQCAVAGVGRVPQWAAADLAESLYLSSARSLALCSLTGMYGCTYMRWAYAALQAAWARLQLLQALFGGAGVWLVGACASRAWRLLLAGKASLVAA